MLPPAPPRFSTITGWPSRSLRFLPMRSAAAAAPSTARLRTSRAVDAISPPPLDGRHTGAAVVSLHLDARRAGGASPIMPELSPGRCRLAAPEQLDAFPLDTLGLLELIIERLVQLLRTVIGRV